MLALEFLGFPVAGANSGLCFYAEVVAYPPAATGKEAGAVKVTLMTLVLKVLEEAQGKVDLACIVM